MWKIDYHIHTVYSDGAAHPAAIVKTAASKGLDAIAITDHDGIDGVGEAIREGKAQGIKVASGIELATEHGTGNVLHILGYNFDPENKALLDRLEYMTEQRDIRNAKLVRVLQELGYDITMEELLKGRNNTFVGKPTMARMMEAKGYIDNWREAFTPGEYLESPEARAIKKVKVDSAEAVKTIIAAGGMPVLAHPIQAKRRSAPDDEAFYERIDRVIGELSKAGLYGLECYHPDQNEEQSARFLSIAKKYGLKISRGTDFHDLDYNHPKTTAEYIGEGNDAGYGRYPEDFIEI